MTLPQPDNCVEGDWCSINGVHRFCHEAMATTFEIYIQHDDARYAQQAARAAFNELDRLEAELSRFIENSDISRINNLAAGQSARIGLDTFECLHKSLQMCIETGGAFDIAFGSPQIANLAEGGSINLIKLNETDFTVELLHSPLRIDLGGIGKGYALDKMAELLREWSIDVALLHGGYSSVLALNAPANTKENGWPITLSNPCNRKQTLTYLYLQNRAMSGSGLQWSQHIINPRQARPVEGKVIAWSCAGDAATADALSTAFMVMTPDEIKQYCSNHPNVQALVILEHEGKEVPKDKILRFGSWDF
jgi:thiamine biosynthesis lipoprotein